MSTSDWQCGQATPVPAQSAKAWKAPEQLGHANVRGVFATGLTGAGLPAEGALGGVGAGGVGGGVDAGGVGGAGVETAAPGGIAPLGGALVSLLPGEGGIWAGKPTVWVQCGHRTWPPAWEASTRNPPPHNGH